MANGIIDPNAGRYRGKDPAAARACHELQAQMRRLREDPQVKIVALTSIVGTYLGVPMAGRTTVDGLTPPGNHWGMRTEPTNRAILVVNTLESPTNSASAIAINTVLIGSRRANVNGQDTVFVSAMGGTDYLDPGPDGEGGGPGTTPGGIPPADVITTTPGGCPLTKTVVIANAGVSSGTFTVTYNSAPGDGSSPQWEMHGGAYGPAGEIEVFGSGSDGAGGFGYWLCYCYDATHARSQGYYILVGGKCPPNGVYPNQTADDILGHQDFGPSSTCTIS